MESEHGHTRDGLSLKQTFDFWGNRRRVTKWSALPNLPGHRRSEFNVFHIWERMCGMTLAATFKGPVSCYTASGSHTDIMNTDDSFFRDALYNGEWHLINAMATLLHGKNPCSLLIMLNNRSRMKQLNIREILQSERI